MATAPLSLGTGDGRRRRYWPAARGGRKTGGSSGGCLHFHVHFHHSPRQVRVFLPPFSSLLPHLFILTVLAFLVCFGWFTLVYFVSSLLLRTGDSSDSGRLEENCRRDDSEERCKKEEQASNKAETDGDYYRVAEGGTRSTTTTASSCTGTVDNPVYLQSDQEESVGNRKEAPAHVSRSETVQLVGKLVTRTVVVICPDYRSAAAAAAAQGNAKSGAELLLPDGEVAPEDFFGQQRDAQTTAGATDVRTTELREESHLYEEQQVHVSSVSDKTTDLSSESGKPALLLLDSARESDCAAAISTPPDASFHLLEICPKDYHGDNCVAVYP